MRKILAVFFVIAWAAGEAPRLWRGAAWPVRPMDLAAGLLFLADIISNKKYKSYKNVGLVIAAAILGPYALRTLVYIWLIWRSREIFAPVRRWIMPSLATFLVLGLGQYLLLPDMRFLLLYGWDEHYYRLVGTVLDPNYFGVMAGIIGIYFLNKCYKNYKFNKQKAIILMALASFITLVLTWSRASWLAVGVGMGWWVLAEKSGRLGKLVKFGILGVFGIIVWWAAPKPGGEGVNLLRTSSIEQRLVSVSQGIEVWKRHPWFGVGFNQYGSNLPTSSFLVVLQATGLAGVVGVVIGGIRVIREIRGNRLWLAIAIMLGVHAVFNNTLFYPPVLGLLALLKCKYQILTPRAAR